MEKERLDGCIRTGEIAASMILCLVWVYLLGQVLEVDFVPLQILNQVILDANGFLSVICLLFIFMALYVQPVALRLLGLGVFDFILLNRLYSDTRWREIFQFLKTADTDEITVYVVILIICIFGLIIIRGIKHKGANRMLESMYTPKEGKMEQQRKEHSEKENASMENKGMIQDEHKGLSAVRLQMATSTIAISLEILLLLFKNYVPETGALGKFLAILTDNIFVGFLSLIILYLILHILCMVILNFLFPNLIETELTGLMRKRTDAIETKIVVFVCNLFEGLVSLLNFVPEFFNTLSCILLDQEGLFPTTNGSRQEETEEISEEADTNTPEEAEEDETVKKEIMEEIPIEELNEDGGSKDVE